MAPNDKLLLGGTTHDGSALVCRVNSWGTLDTATDGDTTAFGTQGCHFLNKPAFGDVAVLDNGSVIVTGWGSAHGSPVVWTGRLNDEGVLDTNYGIAGFSDVVVSAAGATPVAIEPLVDGGVLIVGNANNGANSDLFLLRLDAHGAPDTAFGPQGLRVAQLGRADENIGAFLVDDDGGFYVGGALRGAGVDSAFVAHLLANGDLDTAFGGDGVVEAALGGDGGMVRHLMFYDDDTLIATGYIDNGLRSQTALLALRR
jgi:uncharacterized delta-60 repeat protein